MDMSLIEGSTLRPCDETLATQLEEGYLKFKPFRFPNQRRSSSQPRSSLSPDSLSAEMTPKAREPNARYPSDDLDIQPSADRVEAREAVEEASSPQTQQKTHRLFGAHMNSTVTYEDSKIAWILTDDFLSRMSSTVYQRFIGGDYRGGMKVVRGYSESKKTKDAKNNGERKVDATASESAKTGPDSASVRNQASPHGEHFPTSDRDATQSLTSPAVTSGSPTRIQALERQISDLAASAKPKDPAQQEEEARQREEREMEDDYRDDKGVDQDRDIEHLILATHGVGQRLSLRMESVNFVHDVNVLRKTLKNVYASSADLQALNNEVDKLPKNSRVQVLPVCWRHLLDFPKQRVRPNRKEHDLGDLTSLEDEENYPSLDDITLEGVPAVRSLITDLALDILLYQSAYKEHISRIVRAECNRIFKLFSKRNPNFKGHVSLLGHSLGSAIMFDILCDQKDRPSSGVVTSESRKSHETRHEASSEKGGEAGLDLEFEVDSLFCIGSPIGLFQMLNGRTIAARNSLQPSPSSSDIGLTQKYSSANQASISSTAADKSSSKSHLSVTVSSPKCARLYNIFHPTDPISYRIEPLISPAMSSLPPQSLPYTKKGIFGAPVSQGLSGIGAKVGQSVSGLWTSFSSGITTSLLNRSLGISGEDLKNGLPTHNGGQLGGTPSSIGAGTNISGGNVIATTPTARGSPAVDPGDDKKRKLGNDLSITQLTGEHPPTLIDGELETLYSGFQKRRKSYQSDGGRDLGESPEWQTLEETARRIKREEQKLRALNPNGRVDYSIQE